MDIQAIRKKTFESIKPLKTVDTDSYGAYRMNAGRKLPEYYLVYFLLVDLLGFDNLGRHEKVAWSIPIGIEGQMFSIEHRKMGLGIFASDKKASEEAARKAVQLVQKGVKVAQPYFDWRAETAVKGSQVNVRNQSNDLYQRFQFLLDMYEAKASEEAQTYETASLGIRVPNYQVSREAGWLALAAIESFFSWTEHVFIHLAVLQGSCTTGEDVKGLAYQEWQAKFKVALDINEPQVKYYYDELLTIRNQVRNFFAHGAFGKEGEAFRFHSGAGAVPVKLPHSQGSHSYRFPSKLEPFRGFADDDAIKLIKGFIDYIRSGSLAPAWIYLDSDLDLVLTMSQAGIYSSAMTSEDDMKELTVYQEYMFDKYADMDF